MIKMVILHTTKCTTIIKLYYLKSGGAFNNDIVLSECRDIASDIWLIEPATAEIKSHKSLQKMSHHQCLNF